MARILDTIKQQDTAPLKTNVLWHKGNTLYIYKDGAWQPLVGGDGSLSSIHTAYADSKDGTLNFSRNPIEEKDYKYLGVVQDVLDEESLNNPATYFWNKVLGPQGEAGPRGPRGPQGEVGPQGPTGEVATQSYLAMVYCSSLTKPNKPQGGSWNHITNEFIYPIGWESLEELTPPIWMSQKTFYSEKSLEKDWTDPIQINTTGEKGEGIEFKYKLSKNINDKPSIPNTDWNPSEYDWEDFPQGIDENNQCEWVITRIYSNNSWSNWYGPTIWAKWGEQGTDGSGVEYIYWRSTGNNGIPPSNPTPIKWYEDSEYQDLSKEYVPTELGWSDVPIGVDSTNTFEWVSTRKYKVYTFEDGRTSNGKIWGPFSEPALWSHYGEDGISPYNIQTLYAVSDTTTQVPPHNPYSTNPGSAWGKFPLNYNLDTIVWATDAYIDVDGKLIGEWTQPRIITGIKGELQIPVFYSSNYFATYVEEGIEILAPVEGLSVTEPITSLDTKGNIINWLDYPNNSSVQWVQCVAKVNSETAKVVEWGAVSVWNGKNGEALPSNSWKIKVAIITEDDLDGPDINLYTEDPNTGIANKPWKDPSDSTLKVLPGQRMWETKAEFDSNGKLKSSWSIPYPLTGEKGLDGSIGKQGIAGISYREMYMTGTEGSPRIGWSSSNSIVLNPAGWSLKVPSVTAVYPYIWCIKTRTYKSESNEEVMESPWEGPFRLSGLNGADGTDAVPTSIAVLDNPSDVVVADSVGKITVGLPVTTNFKIYKGAEKENVTYFNVVCEEHPDWNGITYSANIVNGEGVFTITGLSQEVSKSLHFKMTGKCKGSSLSYVQSFTVKILTSNDLPIQSNLLNDSVVIPANSSNSLLVKEVYNKFDIYIGTASYQLDTLYLSTEKGTQATYNGVTFEPTKNQGGKFTGEFKLTLNDSAFITDSLILYITGEYTYQDSTKTVTLPMRLVRISNGKDIEYYQLSIDNSAIIYDPKTNTFTPEIITVKVNKYTGQDVTPVDVEDLADYKLQIKSTVDYEDSSILTSSTIQLNDIEDLESNIKLELINTITNSILDVENIPILSNGISPTTFKLVPSVDVIQYDPEGSGAIVNIPSNNGIYDYSCSILKISEDKVININDYPSFLTHLRGYDVSIIVDGQESNYIPGSKMLATSVKNEVHFELSRVLGGKRVLIDYVTIPVIKTTKGSNGQLVYPAGLYNIDYEYRTNTKTAPYVLDEGEYYVLSKVGVWKGTNQPAAYNTPSKNYANKGEDAEWQKFEMYKALYSDIGVFGQALVGSAVFYKEYIFSQNGIDLNNNFSSHFENFLLDASGNSLYEDGYNPYSTLNSFRPSFCINCKTGAVYFNHGRTAFMADGSALIGCNEYVNPEINQNLGIYALITRDDGSFSIGNGIMRGNKGGTVIIGKTSDSFKFNADGSGNFGGDTIVWENDGSGSLGKGLIKWDTDSVTLGRDGNSIELYNNGLSIANIGYFNYTVVSGAVDRQIKDKIGYSHYFYVRDHDVSDFTITYKESVANHLDTGYIGDIIIYNSNSNPVTCNLKSNLFGGITGGTKTVTINADSLACFKMFKYGSYIFNFVQYK